MGSSSGSGSGWGASRGAAAAAGTGTETGPGTRADTGTGTDTGAGRFGLAFVRPLARARLSHDFIVDTHSRSQRVNKDPPVVEARS